MLCDRPHYRRWASSRISPYPDISLLSRTRDTRRFYAMHWNRNISVNQSTVATTPNCSCCGAVVRDGFDSCRGMFNTVLEREYSNPAYGEAHLFTVDAFCLQHSEQCGPRSNAFHLMRLCWLLEYGGDPSIGRVQRGGRAFYDAREKTYDTFSFLEPPTDRGALTVLSVLDAQSPQDHAERARAWGQCVWDTWSRHHTWAREQVRQWFQLHSEQPITNDQSA